MKNTCNWQHDIITANSSQEVEEYFGIINELFTPIKKRKGCKVFWGSETNGTKERIHQKYNPLLNLQESLQVYTRLVNPSCCYYSTNSRQLWFQKLHSTKVSSAGHTNPGFTFHYPGNNNYNDTDRDRNIITSIIMMIIIITRARILWPKNIVKNDQ